MRRLPPTLSSESFKVVWSKSRDSKGKQAGASGVDRISAAEFSKAIQSQISQIRSEISANTYKFSKLRAAIVEKKIPNTYRIIAIPTVRDRLLQRVLLTHLRSDKKFQAYLNSAISYGFNEGKHLENAIRDAQIFRQKKPWVLQADIIKFFDRIPRSTTKELVNKKVRSKAIATLICQSIDCEVALDDQYSKSIARQNGLISGMGLRQGMPLSPVISNLLLRTFDKAIEKAGICAIRYADDIAVFANSRAECETAESFIRNELKKFELTIPELASGSKTVISDPSATIEFLGIEIKRYGNQYKILPPFKKIQAIKQSIDQQAKVENCIKSHFDIGKLSQFLDRFTIGHKNALRFVDNADEFHQRLEAAKREALKKLLEEIFGSNRIANLNQDQMAILGIGKFKTEKTDKRGR